MSQIVKWHGNVFEMLSMQDVTVGESFTINRELIAVGALTSDGSPMRWADLVEASYQQADMIEQARKDGTLDETNPALRRFGLSVEGQTLASVVLWVSAVRAGIDLPPSKIFDMTPGDIEYLLGPQDHAPKASSGASKKRKRKASGPAAAAPTTPAEEPPQV